MHELLDPISEDSVETLQAMMAGLTFHDNDVRVGANGIEKLSVYETTKWLEWSREDRAAFKAALPEAYVTKAVIGSFLHLPADTGFLDTQDFWTKTPMAGTMISYALEDDMDITINGETIPVAKGEGIKFHLSHVHEISTKATDQNWACLMCMI
jgi:hypothetical protein